MCSVYINEANEHDSLNRRRCRAAEVGVLARYHVEECRASSESILEESENGKALLQKVALRRELDKDNEKTPPDDMLVNETHLAEPQTEDEDKMCEEYELTQIKEKLVIQCVLMNGKVRNTWMCEAQ